MVAMEPRTPHEDLKRELQDPEFARLYAIEEEKAHDKVDRGSLGARIEGQP